MIVAAIVLGAVGLFALFPALHAARRTTAEALAGSAGGAVRRSTRVGRLADRLGLPVPATVGARGAARRGRTTLTVLALAVTVTSAVATLGMEASIDVGTDPGTALPVPGLETPGSTP